MAELTLTEIWIYPVKSLGGIQVPAAQVLEKGLEGDRRFMLIDESGVAMTQRIFPKMALFKTSIRNNALQIRYAVPGAAEEPAPFPVSFREQSDGISVSAIVWNDMVAVTEPEPGLSEWFSAILGVRCRFVQFPEENPRPVDPVYRVNDEQVSLADAFPFLIIGERSLQELNQRLEQPVPMNRFRPNFVFSGGSPFIEDTWREFLIGKSKFAAVKPCARCVLTTVDQVTGERGVEPLQTLSTFRRHDNKVMFGQNLVALERSTVKQGDIITPLSTL